MQNKTGIKQKVVEVFRFLCYNQFMKISGLEKFSMVDFGEKICATVFTPSCNFACPFCHNGDLALNKNIALISEEEVFEYLSQRKKLLDAVVISGGEPTLQADLPSFLTKIKKLGYVIKLDTNGSNPYVLKKLVCDGLVDFVAMDVKNSLTAYPVTVGKPDVDLNAVKESVDFLLSDAVDYEFRTTLVAEFHDEKNITETADWLKGAKIIFLQQFVEKDTCIRAGLHPVPVETAMRYAQILKRTIKTVKLRGY